MEKEADIGRETQSKDLERLHCEKVGRDIAPSSVGGGSIRHLECGEIERGSLLHDRDDARRRSIDVHLIRAG